MKQNDRVCSPSPQTSTSYLPASFAIAVSGNAKLPTWVSEISPPSSRGGSRNVDRDGVAGRDHRRRGHSLRGGADGPSREVAGDSPPVGRRAGADRRDCAPLGRGSQDRPPLPA